MRKRCVTRTDGVPAERLESRLFFASSSTFAPLHPVVAGGANSPMVPTDYAMFVAAVTSPTPTPTPLPTPAPTPTPTPTEPPTPPVVPVSSVIRIDAGRGPHTDLSGRTWGRDEGFSGGSVTITPYEVANTIEDPLYYTRRWGNFEYHLSVPNGSYDVRLHFADPVYTTAGKRKFHVFAEGNLVLNRFDVAAYGGGKSALVRSLIVTVADASLDLKFQSVVDNAILSAIEVVPRNTTGWTAMTAAPVAVNDAQTASVNGRIYVLGGYDVNGRAVKTSNVYDPDADTWTKLADLPRPIVGGATAADGNTIWLAGGFIEDSPGKAPSNNVWKYDVTTGMWTAGPTLPKALAGAAMVRLGRKLRVFGGVDANGVDLADQYVLDLDFPQLGWRTSAPLPTARHHLAGVAIGGLIYAIGGQTGSDPVAGHVSDVHAYNWMTNTWSPVASLPLARSRIGSSTFVGPGNKIFVVGGSTNSTSADASALSDVVTYDPVTRTWAHREWMPGLRSGSVARFLTNRLIVATGSSGPNSPQSSTWTHLLSTVTSTPVS